MGAEEQGGGDLVSVTGVGGPVLVAVTVPELGRGDVLAGRYQIEAVIGSGGSGQVMRAFDRVTRDLVALKILRPEFAADPVWTERFSRELRVGRQIQHPNVCRVFDIGEAEGNRFLSMELATGGTVRPQIEPCAPPRSIDDRIADARAVIDGVAALHRAGIIHRDLKPENILRMGDGRLVVTDFGLATDPNAGPATTIMIGTPRYMAPEVVMGDPADARADVWALGIVLHEILFGCRPDRSVIRRGCRRFTPPAVASTTERALANLFGRCSEDDPEARPTSAIEVATAFRDALVERSLNRLNLRARIAWGFVAVTALSALAVVRNQWTSSAVASSSRNKAAAAAAASALQPAGTAADWSKGSTKLAAFAGPIHCFSLVDDGRKLQAIWGTPRKAEDIDVASGIRAPSRLTAETYQHGCPQQSPNGQSLLFEKVSDTGLHVFVSPRADGQDAKELVAGGTPKWLPNGQEFVFLPDSRHAALFAIPTGEMTLITDGDGSRRQLVEQVIDSTGTRLALRYALATGDNEVVVHAFPGLDVLGRVRIPALARRLQFSTRGEVLFSTYGPQGFMQLASADYRSGQTVRRVGQIAGTDVFGVEQVADGLLVVTQRRRRDLWIETSFGDRRLTTDGESVQGALSPDGALLIVQRRVADGRLVLIARGPDGTEQQTTDGPFDITPSVTPDGKSWLYGRLNKAELVDCAVATKKCAVIHTDSMVPGFPAVDPTGRQVAYLTLMNAPRIRIVSRAGGVQRDLGPAGGDSCTPVWTTDKRLWVAQLALNGQMTWVEINTDTGERTGDRRSAPVLGGRDCAVPSSVLAMRVAPLAIVFSKSDESSELIRMASVLPL